MNVQRYRPARRWSLLIAVAARAGAVATTPVGVAVAAGPEPATIVVGGLGPDDGAGPKAIVIIDRPGSAPGPRIVATG